MLAWWDKFKDAIFGATQFALTFKLYITLHLFSRVFTLRYIWVWIKKNDNFECKDSYALAFGSTDIESLIREFWASSGVHENILGICPVSMFFLPYSLAAAVNLFAGIRHRVTEIVLTLEDRNMGGISWQGRLHTMMANGKNLLCVGLSLCSSFRFRIINFQRRFKI